MGMSKLIDADELLKDVNERIEEIRETENWPRLYGAIIVRDMIKEAPEISEANE